MESKKGEKVPEHIQKRVREQEFECAMKYMANQDPVSMFDAWKRKGCPSVEAVKRMS